MTPAIGETFLRRVAVAKSAPADGAALLSCRITSRPSATFFTLAVHQGATPATGIYAGEVEVADTRAPCSLRVVDHPEGLEMWCQPRGPLASTREGLFVRVRVLEPESTRAGRPERTLHERGSHDRAGRRAVGYRQGV
jgi:hypothetical protein